MKAKESLNNKDIAKMVKACKKGNLKAFDNLVDAYSSRLYSYFYSLTRNTHLSEDLLSEVYLKLVKNIKSCDEKRFNAWVYTIACNTFRDYLRKGKNTEISQDESYWDNVGTEPTQNNPNDIFKELDRLDPLTKEMFMLRFYSDLTFKEIAKVLALPIGTVLSKVHRGIKKLKESLGTDYQDWI